MNIGGVLVRAFPDRVEQVREQLVRFAGVEVHGASDDGRMVVTMERETAGELSDLLTRMHDVPGVLSAAVVYHQVEDSDPEEAER